MTTAERIARVLGDPRALQVPPMGVREKPGPSLHELALDNGGKIRRHPDVKLGWVRYTFADGSALLDLGSRWALATDEEWGS
jgi:hypothetical protein